METNNLEHIFARSVADARLTARQTGGKSNEALWEAISQQSDRKTGAAGITKKLGMIVALSITLAAAAMYSGFRYYKTSTAEVAPVQMPQIKPQHLARPHVVSSDSATIQMPEQEPVPMVKVPAKHVSLPKPAPEPADTEQQLAPIQAANAIVQQAADTAVVKQTVYKKPAPVTVQETKTKYVKKKRPDK